MPIQTGVRFVSCHALVTCALALGCNRGGNVERDPPTPTERQLESIGDAYVRATIKLDHPPGSLTELMPWLKEQGNPEEILRSPNDGQNFEIVWGVELRRLKARGSDIPIIAYERLGKDGTRHVLRGRSEVLRMSESELRSAKFPDGYSFPF